MAAPTWDDTVHHISKIHALAAFRINAFRSVSGHEDHSRWPNMGGLEKIKLSLYVWDSAKNPNGFTAWSDDIGSLVRQLPFGEMIEEFLDHKLKRTKVRSSMRPVWLANDPDFQRDPPAPHGSLSHEEVAGLGEEGDEEEDDPDRPSPPPVDEPCPSEAGGSVASHMHSASYLSTKFGEVPPALRCQNWDAETIALDRQLYATLKAAIRGPKKDVVADLGIISYVAAMAALWLQHSTNSTSRKLTALNAMQKLSYRGNVDQWQTDATRCVREMLASRITVYDIMLLHIRNSFDGKINFMKFLVAKDIEDESIDLRTSLNDLILKYAADVASSGQGSRQDRVAMIHELEPSHSSSRDRPSRDQPSRGGKGNNRSRPPQRKFQSHKKPSAGKGKSGYSGSNRPSQKGGGKGSGGKGSFKGGSRSLALKAAWKDLQSKHAFAAASQGVMVIRSHSTMLDTDQHDASDEDTTPPPTPDPEPIIDPENGSVWLRLDHASCIQQRMEEDSAPTIQEPPFTVSSDGSGYHADACDGYDDLDTDGLPQRENEAEIDSLALQGLIDMCSRRPPSPTEPDPPAKKSRCDAGPAHTWVDTVKFVHNLHQERVVHHQLNQLSVSRTPIISMGAKESGLTWGCPQCTFMSHIPEYTAEHMREQHDCLGTTNELARDMRFDEAEYPHPRTPTVHSPTVTIVAKSDQPSTTTPVSAPWRISTSPQPKAMRMNPVRIMPVENTGLTVLSLFDGIAGALTSLKAAGIKVRVYYAVEKEAPPRTMADHAHPPTSKYPGIDRSMGHLVEKISEDMIAVASPIGFVPGGWPCTGTSRLRNNPTSTPEGTRLGPAGKRDGLKEKNSILFYELKRVWFLVVKYNPYDTPKYMFENVNFTDLPQCYDEVCAIFGCPLAVNAKHYSYTHRRRLYWANLKGRPDSAQ